VSHAASAPSSALLPSSSPSLRNGAGVLIVASAKLHAELQRELSSGRDGWALGALHAARLDRLLAGQFGWAGPSGVARPKGVAIAAVGSLGRGAVALASDADIRVIFPDGFDAEEARPFVDALLYPLWDAKISIGHQVTGQADTLALAQTDLATATALVDLRHLAGDEGRTTELRARAFMGLFAEEGIGDFVDRLEEEAATRHAKFGGSVYLLEPDVKSGPGGLRDVEGARWAARARFHVTGSAPAGDGSTWSELVRMGVLVAREAQGIAEAEELLWKVRNRLHAHAGRRSDRLTFDEQESIAAELGYAEGDGAEARALGAEAFMQDYYRKARVVTHARDLIFERARVRRRSSSGGMPRAVDLGDGVRLFDGSITVESTSALRESPALALRVYAESKRQRAPVHGFARNAISRAAADPAWCEGLRASPEAARLFVDLACTVAEAPARRGSIMAELLDIGLLLAMVPEFAPVTGRVHHDVYHVYTVDVHSVAALDCLRALARGELAQEHPLASRLAAEIARPAPLFLATLLHDIGKGYPDANGSRKNHSESGAELCERILPRFGLSTEDIAEARALVALHLSMYHVATRRDLDDEATIQEFVRPIRGRELLRDLYLLTIADISTTSPTAMTSWKARMLEELYRAADANLSGDARALDFDRGRILRVSVEARGAWKEDPAVLDAFLVSMPERYLLSNPVEAVVAHAAVAAARGASKVHAALVPSRHRDVAELCVVAEDRPGLLARIAAAITAGRLEVLGAQVYSRTRADGVTEAVDLFWVRDRVDGQEGVERGMPRLLRDLGHVCADEGDDAARLLRAKAGSPWRERPSPHVPTEVVLDDRASPHHTVVEVFAKDRPGLLYTLAQAIHDLDLSIAVSKINTEGTCVADVFYVQERDGSKVVPGERFKEIRSRLREVIDGT
jgi:[protein-PII] uridylyltransferase